MAVKYYNPGLIILGLILCAGIAAAAFFMRKKQARRAGVRAANTERFRALPAYRRKRLESLIVRGFLAAGLIVSIVSALFLTARPYGRNTIKEDASRRDIFLCMDLSASSSAGTAGFVEEFRKLVPELEGDQIGISLFNTSSVQYVPVTDDYKFLLQRLDELGEYFRAEEEFKKKYTDVYEYVYEIPENERARYEELNVILSAFDKGATAGYEKKGTSAVGEGLASCLFSFPELYTEKRTRIILFVTDNIPEYIGTPLTTLEEVADMCVYDNVTVYGVYPDIPGGEGNPDTQGAKDQMKAAVETTGGTFFDLSGPIGAKGILEEIHSREQTDSKTVIATREEDHPEMWSYILYGGIGITAACLLFLLIKGGKGIFKAWTVRKRILAGVMAALIIACTVLIAVRPMKLDESAEIRTNNLDVCFVVDTTISMWAEDYGGKGKRMTGVKEDIAQIMDALPGSSFALIRFDNGAQILAPYTQNFTALTDCLENISLPSYATAEGSSLNTAHDALESMIQASEEKTGRRKTIVFLFSDGEITDGSELMSFKDIEKGVDDGAVLGYGTTAGGRMNYPGKGYLKNTAEGKDALSVIDEKNLKSIAGDLGLTYVRRARDGSTAVGQILRRIRLLSRDTALRDGDRTGWEETYYYFSGILALLLTGLLFRFIRRGSVL